MSQILKNPKTDADFIERACRTLEEQTGIYISSTDLPMPTGLNNQRRQRSVFRVAITNPYTEIEHVDLMLDELQAIWDQRALAL